jgi:importin subunit alpha-1
MRSIPVIQKVLAQCDDNEVVQDALWSLYYLSERQGNSEELSVFVNIGFIKPSFLCFLTIGSYSTPVLKLLGNLAAGTDYTTQAVLDGGFLQYVSRLLEVGNSGKLREICWILSNIAAGTQEQAQTLIDSKILPKIIHILKKERWEIKKECIYIFSNMVGSKNPEHVDYIFNIGAIKALCDTMSLARECPKTIKTILNAIYNILDTGRNTHKFLEYVTQVEEYGLDHIEDFQNHPNQQVYEKSVAIIDEFFGEESAEMTINMEIDSNARFNF